jgi:hypothetical protein
MRFSALTQWFPEIFQIGDGLFLGRHFQPFIVQVFRDIQSE